MKREEEDYVSIITHLKLEFCEMRIDKIISWLFLLNLLRHLMITKEAQRGKRARADCYTLGNVVGTFSTQPLLKIKYVPNAILLPNATELYT